jgi:predicted GIY-YIG superfamily endonuclease
MPLKSFSMEKTQKDMKIETTIVCRMEQHNNRTVHYTSDKIPVKLITYIAFTDKYKAFFFEKYLKSGSGKAFLNKRLS